MTKLELDRLVAAHEGVCVEGMAGEGGLGHGRHARVRRAATRQLLRRLTYAHDALGSEVTLATEARERGGDDKLKTKNDDYYINVNPDDVSVKNRRNSTVITDRNTEGGINIEEKFLTDKDKEVLGIENWKSITTAKSVLDGKGDVIKVVLRNKYAAFGNTRKVYKVEDGESFQIAVAFAKELEDRLRYR